MTARRLSRRALIAFGVVGLLTVVGLVSAALVVVPQVRHWLNPEVTEESRTGVPDDAVRSVSVLRQDDGLFELPEAGSQNTIDTKIHATYLSSRLLGGRFGEVVASNTADALYTYTQASSDRQVLQLEAFAALKQIGDLRWKDGVALASEYLAVLPTTVSSDTLASYLAVAEPAYQLDASVPLNTLLEYDPGSDENKQRAAASAIALNYLFANSDAVRGMFPTLQSQMRAWDGGSTVTVAQLLISSVAMQASTLFRETSTEMTKRSTAISGVRGCEGSTYFISVDGTQKSPCSLTLTTIAAAIAS